MAFSTTAKHALRWLTGTSTVNDIDAGFQALAEDLDALIAVDDQGLLASRPTSTPGTPGKTGRYYYATDTSQLFRDFGTGWAEIRVGQVTRSQLADDARRVPGALLNGGGAQQVIPNNANTRVVFDAELSGFDDDPAGLADPTTSRITAPWTGIALAGFTVEWATGNGGAGTRAVWLQRTDSTRLRQIERPGSQNEKVHQLSEPIHVTAGQVFEVLAYQDSGSSQNLAVLRQFSLFYLGDAA